MSKAYFAGRYDLYRDLDMKFVDHIRYVLATTLAEQQKTKRIRYARTGSLEVTLKMQQWVYLTGSAAGKIVAGGEV